MSSPGLQPLRFFLDRSLGRNGVPEARRADGPDIACCLWGAGGAIAVPDNVRPVSRRVPGEWRRTWAG